jgi:hypothetical protein
VLAAANHDRPEKQVALVDQAQGERLAGEVCTPDRDVSFGGLLEPADRIGVEVALDPGPRAGYRLEVPGVHDLLRRPPDLGEVPDHHRLIGAGAHGLPEDHRLVHPATVKVGADRPLEIVDKSVHLAVRRGPVEVARFVLDVPVERGDRCIDQLRHRDSNQW